MVQVLIPTTNIVQKDSKPYTVYCIELFVSGKCFKIDRRYSEFYELHRKLLKKKTYQLGTLPPKKLKNLNQKLIEQRRTSLESYLQQTLRTVGLDKTVELNEFLNLPINEPPNLVQKHKSLFTPRNQFVFTDEQTTDQFNDCHQCMIGFKNDYLFPLDYDLNYSNSLSSTNSIFSSADSQKSETNSCASSSSTNSNGSLPDILVLGSLDAIYK